MKRSTSALFISLCLASLSVCTWAEDSAVVLLYHHVSEDTPSSTSVTPRTFARHLKHLEENGYHVMPFELIVENLQTGTPLPERALAITFDDAFQSIHDTAAPMLANYQWPFTVFVNTEPASKQSDLYMDWDELRRAEMLGASIQNHGHSHDSLAFPLPHESRTSWRTRVTRDISTAQEQIKRHLGKEARLFAYPYGEYSPELQDVVRDLGLIGVGQQSGAVGPKSDFWGLPRHPFYIGADNLERFDERIRTKPLYLSVQPDGPLRVSKTSRIDLDFMRSELSSVSCFFDGKAVQFENNRLNGLGPFTQRRTKLNCTQPMGAGRYRWWSYLFIRP